MVDSELGRVLLTLRGFQWIIGTKDDPYALLLRAASDDPHLLGRRVRERGPLYFSSAEAWVTATRAHAITALRDSRLCSRQPDPPAGEPNGQRDPMPWEVPPLRAVLPLDDAFLNFGRADYEQLRRAADPVLGKDAVARHWFAVVAVWQERLARCCGEFDLMTDYARRATADAVSVLFGLPVAEQDRFAELGVGTAGVLDAILCPPSLNTARRLTASLTGIRDLFAEAIGAKRAAPANDLISELLAVMGDADVLAVCMLAAATGVEVTANLVCNTMEALLAHPDHWQRVLADRDLAGDAVEETLRYAPPVRLQRLYATEDIELAGQPVEAGCELVVLIEAVNRDPAGCTDDPDRFDITRRGPQPLSLVDCPQTALLDPLVRLQAVAAIQAIAAGLPGVRRTGDVLRRLRSPVTGGVLRLPVAS